MSEIEVKYQEVIQANPWIGAPTGPEQACQDGNGRFQDYQGGASIYYTPATGAHLIYGLIRAKWIHLGRERGPNGYPITDEADAISGYGRFNNFQNGTIIWKRGTPEAFSVYGAIYGKWGAGRYDAGPLGFPLTDETDCLFPNIGRYNDFEHGAIYYNATAGTHVVMSPILEAWSVINRDMGPLKFPTTDTRPAMEDQNAYTQSFQGGDISCKKDYKSQSLSIVSSSLVTSRVKPLSRALELADYSPDDTRVCKLTRLDRHLQLNAALVIFRGSYTRTLDDAEIATLKARYIEAATAIRKFTFGLGQIKTTMIISESNLQKSDFGDCDLYGQCNIDGDPNTFQPSFKAYSKVLAALQSQGFTADDFDIVSIDIPWEDTNTDKAGVACADPIWCLGNEKTYSTVHFIHPGPMWGNDPANWWAFWAHEITHCIEWMLESKGYPQLRNNDDRWWGDRYPKLTSSTVVPPPENLKEPGDPRLYAMHLRIKSDWFNLYPKWGEVITDFHAQHETKILMYSCPDSRTVIETAWVAQYPRSVFV